MFPDNGISRGKQGYQLLERIRLPTGRTITQIQKKQVVDDDNDNVDSIGADGDDELIDQLDGLNFYQIRKEKDEVWLKRENLNRKVKNKGEY